LALPAAQLSRGSSKANLKEGALPSIVWTLLQTLDAQATGTHATGTDNIIMLQG